MTRLQRSSLTLTFLGLAGAAFFVLTDPAWGVMAWNDNPVDALNYGRWGTYVGLAGSIAAAGIGLWLVTRKTA